MPTEKNATLQPMFPPIRILIADDHPVIRFGIKSMLVDQPAFEVIGEAVDGEDAITQTLELDPDILLLDLRMPKLLGMEAMRAIVVRAPHVKVILLTALISPAQIVEAIELGARGIILKNSISGELGEALRAVFSGESWIEGKRVPNLLAALTEQMKQAATPEKCQTYGMTPRELNLVQCIVEGCTNRDAARQLVISEQTVKRHLTHVYQKTGMSNRLELAMFAIEHNVVLIDLRAVPLHEGGF